MFIGGYPGEFYISYNEGESWELRINGIENEYIGLIETIGDYLFASSFVSQDNGNTWFSRSEGLRSEIECLVEVGDYVFAGTYYGVYRTLFKDLEITSVQENTMNDNISIYPNPASEYITITKPSEGFEPSEGSGIKIFNTLGECVMTVETRHAVSLQRIDVSHLPRGVYYLRIGSRTEMFVKV